MIKSNKEVTLKTRETFFLYRKSQKLIIAKVFFDNYSQKQLLKIFSFPFFGMWHSAKKSGRLSQK